jgi:outer membrane protein OmpA-like peptidoglycan-associated protein
MDHASLRPAPARTLGAILVAASLLALATPARADGGGASLELFLGPHDLASLTLKSITLDVDGTAVQVPVPGPLADPAQAAYRAPIGPGQHVIKLTISASSQNSFFTYVDLYALDMKGKLELLAPQAGSIRLNAKVLSNGQFDADFLGGYRLDFSAVRTALPIPEVADTDEEPETTPAMHLATPSGCRLGPVTFRVLSAEIDKRGQATLDRFAACLKQSSIRVTLEGHCDRSGTEEINQQLGMKRARAAAEYLEAQGIPASRLAVVSRAATLPACEESNKECYAKNRRVVGVVPVLEAGAPRP